MPTDEVTPCKSWIEVDQEMERICAINEGIKNLKDELSRAHERITKYAFTRKDTSLKGGKVKQLNHGSVQIVTSASFRINNNAKCLELLKLNGMTEHITECPNRESLARLENDDLALVGASRSIQTKVNIKAEDKQSCA